MSGFAALTIGALVGLLLAEYRDARAAIWLFKPLASAGFCGAALSSGALDSVYGSTVLVALCLSCLGDVLLVSPRSTPFLAGLIAFLLAHVAYCAAFVLIGPSLPVAGGAAVALAVPGLLVARWLLPHLEPRLRAPVAAYVLVITAMAALAMGAVAAGRPMATAVGALAFYVSDISVAVDRFVARAFVHRLWGLPLYYAAQLTLAWTVAR